MNKKVKTNLNGKRVLITGGLGMIGSTIAIKLVECGAEVTIADSCLEPYGSNLQNIANIKDRIQVSITDIRDKDSMKVLVQDKDIVFNLAGQVSHNDSMDDPFLDADINYLGHMNVLENLAKHNPTATVLYSGSRLQFGKTEKVLVDEDHPLRPRTPYALNKSAAESMYLFYNEMYSIPCVLFRIANPYGPRSQMKHHKYSMINWFIRTAMEGGTIKIFGDGLQIRDYIYVDDLADAFIESSVTPACHGEVFNVGSGEGTMFKDMVDTVVDVVGSGDVEYIPWPDNYINVETGDYITDITKLTSMSSWKPDVNLKEGIRRTFNYYKEFGSYYWKMNG